MRGNGSEARFWSKVDKSGDCWLWIGFRMRNGYGTVGRTIGHTKKKFLAHRFAYELTNGPIPPGLDVCHSCDVRACVRPDHLWLGTRRENMADAVRKGRTASGDKNSSRMRPERVAWGERTNHSALTNAQAAEVRRLARLPNRESYRVIAARFGISESTVSYIGRGNGWRRLE